MVPLFLEKPLHYVGIVGTGGIGSGRFFVLNGNHTLGREESRSGHFMDVRDYCKQHIILHYVTVLLGDAMKVVPVGLVGADDVGTSLIQEMRDVGFVLDHVETRKDLSTLFSFCFHYPDGTGGNLTTSNSASAAVDSEYIDKAENRIRQFGNKGIVLAAPEVPMTARGHILELGKRHGAFCAASFTSEEIVGAANAGMLNNVDLIAINADEARTLVGASDADDVEALVESAVTRLAAYNPGILISVTAGKKGSWCWDTTSMQHLDAFPAVVASTAGAGDAFFGGLLTGISAGFSFHEAHWLASLVAACSVTSRDTIHRALDRTSLKTFANDAGISLPGRILRVLNKS